MLIYRDNGLSRILSVLLVASMVSTIGCAKKAMLVSDSDWDPHEEMYEGYFRIKLTDGRDFEARRIARTDSSVVIYELFRNRERIEIDPLEIRLSDIDSIKKSKVWWPGTIAIIVVIGGVVVIVGVVGFYAYTSYVLAGLLSNTN